MLECFINCMIPATLHLDLLGEEQKEEGWDWGRFSEICLTRLEKVRGGLKGGDVSQSVCVSCYRSSPLVVKEKHRRRNKEWKAHVGRRVGCPTKNFSLSPAPSYTNRKTFLSLPTPPPPPPSPPPVILPSFTFHFRNSSLLLRCLWLRRLDGLVRSGHFTRIQNQFGNAAPIILSTNPISLFRPMSLQRRLIPTLILARIVTHN